MEPKEQIKELIEKYNKIVEEKRLKKYTEEDTKKDFILPLFEALGWNVHNKPNKNDNVSAEERISRGRVDYSFRLNGIPKFFLEAKALKIDLDDPKFIKQAINYAWHKGCTWAVLTDFEAVKIFNAEWKTSNPLQTHLKTIPYYEFLDRFEELWLLSKESFEKGLLDKEAEKWGKRTKKIPIDKQLLSDFTRFRELLSKNINKLNQNQNITEEDLDESVQRILDRLLFIRNCEDRELEEPQLKPILREYESHGKVQLIEHLKEVFVYFDKQYNSKIFAEHLCDNLKIDSDVLSEIISGLYQTKDKSVSYNFAYIEADVLGNIYEQYLGHILKKTAKRAKITSGKAYRKEQGIYYTPTYIVNYIVRNTLGELLKKKKTDVEKIRILDPACGSGSFLIKAFDVLNEYWKNKDKKYSQTQLDPALGTPYTKKSKILKDNIFGVDLDKQAVEIAQLNLLVKIAERGHRLPLLQQNIKNGNSLIDDEEIAGDKAFKWGEEFKEITEEGGFDVVIGNPPWSSKISTDENKLLAKKLGWSEKNINICALFIYHSLKKLKLGGVFGFLLPKVVIKNLAYFPVRKEILSGYHLKQIIDFGQFPGVASDAVGLIIERAKSKSDTKIRFFEGTKFISENPINQEIFQKNSSNIFSLSLTSEIQKILDKINKDSKELKELFNIKRGIELGQKSLIVKCDGCGTHNEAESKYYGSEKKKCKKCNALLNLNRAFTISSSSKSEKYTKKCISGNQLKRYSINKNYFIPENLEGINYKKDAFKGNKILIKRISTKVEGTFSEENLLAFNTVYSVYNENLSKNDFLVLLGILNSRLIHFFYEFSYNIGMNLTTQVTVDFLSKIPIKQISKTEQQPLIKLLDKMLSLNKRLNEIGDKKTDEMARIKEEIKKTDKEIDDLVYKLYGLTNKEIKVVEESLK